MNIGLIQIEIMLQKLLSLYLHVMLGDTSVIEFLTSTKLLIEDQPTKEVATNNAIIS